MHIRRLLTVMAAASAALCSSQNVRTYAGLGNLHRKVTTQIKGAQVYFDQGLAFLYAFNHDEARRAFRRATQLDPKCAMAWWGIATANGPHINNPMVSPEHEKEAYGALLRARNLKGSAVERALIAAASKRFTSSPNAGRTMLDQAYAGAMRNVWRQFPRDPDVGALFAESMMDLRPWDLWKPDGAPQPGTREVVATLERVLRLDPKHPLGMHLYIHAVEASPNPGRASAAADRLRDRQPALGHMVHMPSHIYVRTGRWKDAIIANQKAIAADAAYQSTQPDQGFYRVYMAHNGHMLAFACMMRGQSKLAIDTMDRTIAAIPSEFAKAAAPFVDGFFSMSLEVRVRFGKWDEVLEAPDLPEYFPISRTLRHQARGIAYAATGRTEEARQEFEAFQEAKRAIPRDATFGNNSAASLIQVAYHMLAGELLIAEGAMDRGLEHLRLAARTEDQLRYDEPPDWIIPTRHAWGAALLKAGKVHEAARIYREDLKRLPNNGWALYGLSAALRELGQTKEADRVANLFASAWSEADMTISSSCMCLPGK